MNNSLLSPFEMVAIFLERLNWYEDRSYLLSRRRIISPMMYKS
jgi:hypothetical protein